MSTGESPETPAEKRPEPKQTGVSPGAKPGADKAPAPRAEGGAEAEQKKKRPDPTRYGDWEKNGRCIDF